MSLEKEEIEGIEKKGEEVGKVQWRAENLRKPNKIKRGESDYSDEALALFKHHKPLINLWRWSLDVGTRHRIQIRIYFPPRVFNLKLLRAGRSYKGGAWQAPTPPQSNISCNSPAGICNIEN